MKIVTVASIPADGAPAAGNPAAVVAEAVTTPPAPAPAAETPAATTDAAPATEFADVKDLLGRGFHPAKFRLKDGKPHVDSQGRFVPLGLGAKKKSEGAPAAAASTSTPSAAPRVTSTIPEDAPPAKPDLYGAAAGTIVAGLQTVLITLGQEEGILSPAEKISVQTPLEAVLRKYDVGEPPPELALLVAVGGVVVSRLGKPKTQTNVQKLRMWVAGKIAAWRGGRIAARVASS